MPVLYPLLIRVHKQQRHFQAIWNAFLEKDDLRSTLLEYQLHIPQAGGTPQRTLGAWFVEQAVTAHSSLCFRPPAGPPGADAGAGAPMARRGSLGPPAGRGRGCRSPRRRLAFTFLTSLLRPDGGFPPCSVSQRCREHPVLRQPVTRPNQGSKNQNCLFHIFLFVSRKLKDNFYQSKICFHDHRRKFLQRQVPYL